MSASSSQFSIRRLDWGMLGVILTLITLSFMFVYSACYRTGDMPVSRLFLKQMFWAAAGLFSYVAVTAFDYRELPKFSIWIYGGAIAGLALVFLFPEINNARRWIHLPGLQVQPSEFAKIAYIIALAAYLADPGRDMESRRTFLTCFAWAAVPFLLIAAEPDLGTAVTLIPITFGMMFGAGLPLKPLVTLVVAGLVALVLMGVWLKYFPETCPFLTEYQKNRVLVYLNVNNDPLGAGWNKLQSQIAVGSGGFYGKGFLKGTQNILGFLPRTVAPTDFIFSVIAEETGFMGGVFFISLYTLLLGRCMRTAVRAREDFGRLLALGIGVMMFCHVFVNIAMTIGLMPITGLPLPLMSYGGSFMVSTMIALGLVQSVYLRRRRR
ncbi:MAG: rod shape-determining protein RodA [Kiritimatiellales bacterium]|nr:rod shape-determining protein RodA [Kiritimatiellales bacterium]